MPRRCEARREIPNHQGKYRCPYDAMPGSPWCYFDAKVQSGAIYSKNLKACEGRHLPRRPERSALEILIQDMD